MSKATDLFEVPCSEGMKAKIRGHMESLIQRCDDAGFIATADHARRVNHFFEGQVTPRDIDLQVQFCHSTLADEVKRWHVLMLDQAEAARYSKGHAEFHPDTASKIVDADYDLDEACRTYAIHAWTACVFHLMRVLERGIQRWGTNIGATMGFVTKNGAGVWRETMWGDLEKDIQKAVDALPESTADEKEAKNNQRAAVAALGNIRHAWRNTTMHPAAKYDDRQARDVFDTTRIFLERLVPILK